MCINITITGLTTQQQQDIGNAFDATIGGPSQGRPEGMSKARWVEVCLIRHIKAVVKGWVRVTGEVPITAAQNQVETDYPEA